jgi:glycosyltransferase involved in cell wall biosynthesis
MKVAFVALSFHLNNTRSSQFFIDILKASFDDLHVVPDVEAWFEIPRLKPDLLIVWQKIFAPAELECFGAKNIVLVPMYDACPHTEEFWAPYRPYKVFCFSRSLYGFLKELSFDALFSRYYPEPGLGKLIKSRELNAFFWERSKLINWACIKALLGGIALDSLRYHTSSNISQANPDGPGAADVEKYKIILSDWFETQEEYSRILEGCTLYFAPRESEGIGHSFIEALSLGLCVIAPDAPTMNEYITNGVNGILYDPSHPEPISLSDIDGIRERALSIAAKARAEWLSSIPGIIDFIRKPLPGYAPRRHPWLYARKRCRAIIRNIYKKMTSAR